MSAQPPAAPSAEGRLLSATAVMASGTLVSRVLGFVRTMLVAFALGNTTAQGDTFTLATVVPNSLYMIFAGGALNTVLVPQIVRHSRNDPDRGEAFIDRIMTAFLLALALVTVLALIFTPQVMSLWAGSAWQAPRMAPHRDTLFLMAYLTMPQVFFYGAFFLVGQVLNARDKFGPMMWAPIVNNIVQIGVLGTYAVVWGSQTDHSVPFTFTQTLILGLGSTVGIIAQTAVLLPAMRSLGVRYRPRFDLKGQGLGSTFHLAKWMIGYVLLTQFAAVVVTRLASTATIVDPANPGAGVLAYNEAYLTWILPHSLLTVSLATAMLPSASRLAAARDLAGVGDETARTLRLANTFLLPAAVGFLVLANPFAQLVFGNGAGAGDWHAVALTLQCLAVGLVPYTIQYVYLRGYYALEDTRTPFFLQIAISGVNAAVAWVWVTLDPTPTTVAPRLALAYSVSYLLGAIITYRALSRVLPTLGIQAVAQHLVRVLLATLPGAVIAGVLTWLASGQGRLVILAAFVASVVGLLGTYAFIGARLGLTEIAQVAGLLLRRLRRGRGGPPSPAEPTQASAAPTEEPGGLPPSAPAVPAVAPTRPASSWTSASEPDAAIVHAGDVLDGVYRLDGVLQRTAGTYTWLATDLKLDRPVLVHVLPQGERRTLDILDAARRAAEVTDTHFLRVLDAVLTEGQRHGSYVVCEYAAGPSLEELLTGGPLTPIEACWLAHEAAEGLVALHAQGLAHRRLSPATVALSATGNVKIVGFVLADALRPTASGFAGDVAADQHADLRALGEVLYAALLGRWPGPPAHGLPGDPGAAALHHRLADLGPEVAEAVERLLGEGGAPMTGAAEATAVLERLTYGTDASHLIARRLGPESHARRAVVEPTVAVRPLAARPVSATSAVREDTAPMDPSTSAWGDILNEDDDYAPFTPVPPPAATAPHAVLPTEPFLGRRWVRIVALGLAVAVLVSVVGLIWNAARPGAPGTSAAIKIVGATDFDPSADGGDNAENHDQAGLAIDGDLATSWTTERYGRSADLNGRKPGVGLVLDLGSVQKVGVIKVVLGQGTTDLDVRVPASDPGSKPPMKSGGDWRVVTGAKGVGREQTFVLNASTRYVLVYLTRLPQATQGKVFMASVAEIAVTA